MNRELVSSIESLRLFVMSPYTGVTIADAFAIQATRVLGTYVLQRGIYPTQPISPENAIYPSQ